MANRAKPHIAALAILCFGSVYQIPALAGQGNSDPSLEMDARFREKYQEWRRHRRLSILKSDSVSSNIPLKKFDKMLFDNEPYRKLVALGPAYLPYFIAGVKEDSLLSKPILEITKWRLRYIRVEGSRSGWDRPLENFPELPGVKASRAGTLFEFWWERGRHKIPTVFEGLYQEWKQKTAAGNQAEADKMLRRITDLGIVALPCIVEKVLAGDEGLRPVLTELSDGAISKDADAATIKTWWKTKKQEWAVLWAPTTQPSSQGK